MKRTTSLASEAARAKLASLARQTTEDIDRRQTVPLPAEKVSITQHGPIRPGAAFVVIISTWSQAVNSVSLSWSCADAFAARWRIYQHDIPSADAVCEQTPCELCMCRSQDIDFGDELYNDGDANSDVASTAHVSQSNQTRY